MLDAIDLFFKSHKNVTLEFKEKKMHYVSETERAN